MPTLNHYLILAAILFSIGLVGALTRRNAILVLVGIEMMMNAAIINFVAFWHFLPGNSAAGQVIALFSITIAGAEAAVGLALVIAVYRHFRNVSVDEIKGLKG
jgi:NADH:ubiquinone oxidoreductase subunit K